MADIAASDVTFSIFEKEIYNKPGDSRKRIRVTGELTVDPGTDDAYAAGGIPLTNLFTAGGQGYTGIDPAFPVHGICSLARYYDSAAATTITPAALAFFNNAGTTAATQKLALYVVKADDGTKDTCFTEHRAEDVSLTTNLTNPLVGSDKDFKVVIQIWGTAASGQ